MGKITFKLSDEFVEQYKNKKAPFGFNGLGELTEIRTYSRIKDDGVTNEKWIEIIRRATEGTYTMQKRWIKENRKKWNEKKAQQSAQRFFDFSFRMKFLPPGRGLWAMGSRIIEEKGLYAALNNCFDGETEFLTEKGIVKLKDVVGEIVNVLTEDGSWRSATVNSFGVQKINEVKLKPLASRSNVVNTVMVTPNHRWILENGKVVTDLAVGDKVKVNSYTNYDKNSKEYKTGFAHGLIFGDGTRHTYYPQRHFIKVCDGNFDEYNEVAKDVDGYLGATFGSKDGYPVITIIRNGENWKALPDLKSPEYNAGFIEGWISADGHIKKNGGSVRLDTQNVDAAEWVIKNAAYAGFVANGYSVENYPTNFGERSAPLNRISLSKKETVFKVVSIQPNSVEEVFCVTEPKTGTFTLAGGILTGNCGFCTTKNIAEEGSKPFAFLMDMSMLGVGIGFDTKGAGTLVIQGPLDQTTEVQIPDTREGWVNATSQLIDAFFFGHQDPIFDYSLIRKENEPIKGFGGVSSGPQPLIDLHNDVRKILAENVGKEISITIIVDIMNLIGKAVVAGNVRRTAEIVFGDPLSQEYLDLKNYNVNPHRAEYGWTSNNSVFAEIGMNYNEIAERIKLNGEPGLAWLSNMQAYSRMKDPPDFKDARAEGGNPCFAGETLIAVADGRGYVSIEHLASEGDDVPVYSLNKNGMVEIKMARNPRKTRENSELVEIEFCDGSKLTVTPEHKMMLLNGETCFAKDLNIGDSLPRFTKAKEKVSKSNSKSYWRVYTNTINTNSDKVFEHRMIAKFYDPGKFSSVYDECKQNGWINGGLVIHHKNYDSLDNSPANLQIMSFADHCKLHAEFDRVGEKNGMFGKVHSDETKFKIGNKTRERCSDEKFVEKLKNSHSKEEREQSSIRMSEMMKNKSKEYYINQAENTDLDTVWIGDKLHARKNCIICSCEMILSWGKRHAVFCSLSCSNKKSESIAMRKNGQKIAFENKQRDTLHNQVVAYKDLKSKLDRNPTRKEWEFLCKERGISFRLNPKSENTFALKNYGQLAKLEVNYNHRVKNVKFLENKSDVYNLTVDDNYTVGVITDVSEGKLSGIFTHQCLEQTLEPYELCTLVENFLNNCETKEEWLEVLKYSYLYAKTVTLGQIHWEEANEVMSRNRRIGCSVSGVAQFITKHGIEVLREWLEDGYAELERLDTIYSEWFGVPKSIKKTSNKPSGSVSLLAGATPGIHYPESRFYIRRMRLSKYSNLIKPLEKAGYKIEPCYGSEDSTVVVEIPVDVGEGVRTLSQVSMWEQLSLAAFMQKYWADNQVSATVTFDVEKEGDQIPHALNYFQYQLKGISFLPRLEKGAYKQMPYEEITEKEYNDLISNLGVLDFDNITGEEADTEKYCSNDSCQL